MLQFPRPLRLLALPVGVLVLALAAAACGGGAKGEGVASLGGGKATSTTNAGASGGYDLRQALVFTRCMRQHGYDIPDPQMEGNNVGLQLPNFEGQRAPKFQAAWQACRRYAPNGGRPERPGAEDRQRALAFARCMRQHGINLPDPQLTAEGIDQPPAPGVRRDDPKQKAAEQACARSLPPDKPGGGGK
jgi:hypothetical protein